MNVRRGHQAFQAIRGGFGVHSASNFRYLNIRKKSLIFKAWSGISGNGPRGLFHAPGFRHPKPARSRVLTRDKLYSFVLKHTCNRHLTEDILQHCYMKLWEHLDKVDVEEGFVLVREYGLSYDEVAERMGISKLTIKKHMNEAFSRQCNIVPQRCVFQ